MKVTDDFEARGVRAKGFGAVAFSHAFRIAARGSGSASRWSVLTSINFPSLFFCQFHTVGEGHHVVRPTVQDHRARRTAHYGIPSIPALLICKDGQIASRHIGVTPEATLRAEMRATRLGTPRRMGADEGQPRI